MRTRPEEKKQKRWTETFEHLPDEKRERILNCAKCAFARSGLNGANINNIAAEAGISIGSLYKYFRTKEDLFLALIEESHELIGSTIDTVLERCPGFFERVECLLEQAVATSRSDPDSVRLYIACTTEELSSLAERLSNRIESVSADKYRAMVAEAKKNGEIRADLDNGWTAFFLDDLFLMTQYSVGSAYYAERLRLFVYGSADPGKGAEAVAAKTQKAQAELVAHILAYIRQALAPAAH